MRSQAQHVHVVDALPIDVGFDQVVREDIALEQKLVVRFQMIEHFAERPGHLFHGGSFVFEEIDVHGFSGLDLVLDAVEAGHQHGGKRQVGVRRGIGAAVLDAHGTGAGAVDRDAHAGGSIAAAVGHIDGRLVAGHQPFVAVGRRRTDGQKGWRVFEDPADVVLAEIAQVGVAVGAVEQVLAVLPQTLVAVHATAVIAEHRLGHEGKRLAVGHGGVLQDVLVGLQCVAHLHQGAEFQVDLHLSAGGDFAVVHLDLDARQHHAQDGLGAPVLQRVDRRHAEVAALRFGPVAQVGAETCVVLAAGSPSGHVGFDLEETAAGLVTEADAVEGEELRLGAPVAGVGDARIFEILFRFLGHVARILVVGLARGGIVDVADDAKRGDLHRRVDDRRGRIGEEDHVRFLDVLEGADARPVETQSLLKHVLGEIFGGHREVVPAAHEISELDVHDGNLALTRVRQDFLGRAGVLDLGRDRSEIVVAIHVGKFDQLFHR